MDPAAHADPHLVAEQLWRFLAEPARHRARLLRAHQAIPGGALILRFARDRFPAHFSQDYSTEELHSLGEAARFFLQQICLGEGASHYQALCLPVQASAPAIKGHYRLLMGLIHPDRQQGAHWPIDSVAKVNRAYEVLSQDSRRAEYDRVLARQAREPAAGARAPMADDLARGEFVTGGGWRAKLGRPWLLASAVVVSLLFFQFWWITDTSEDHEVLESSLTHQLAAKWLGWAYPAPKAKPADEASPEGAPPTRRKQRGAGAQASAEADSTVPAGDSLASAPDSVTTAPAREAAADAGESLASEQVEAMVFLLVNGYAEGDTAGLLTLLGVNEYSAEQLAAARKSWEGYFSSTGSRNLSVDQLTWRREGERIYARGRAEMTATGKDGAPIAKRGSLEMDLVSRGGKAVIARLVLYPLAPAR
jgi:curved DNA-binding protein CbpA